MFLFFISDQEDADYKTVKYKQVYLDDEDTNDASENEEESDKASQTRLQVEDVSAQLTDQDCHGDDPHSSDENYDYSDDHENFSEDSEHDVDVKEQESAN